MVDNQTELAGVKTTEPAKARGKSAGDKSGQKPRPQPTSKKKRKGKTKQREASTLSSIIVILLVILLPPLPFALYMAGTNGFSVELKKSLPNLLVLIYWE